MTNTDNALLFLIRVALGDIINTFPLNVDWTQLFNMSEVQGVDAICIDALNQKPELVNTIPDDPELEYRMFQWFGGVIQMEQQYAQYEMAIDELSAFYKKNDIRLMILKGYGLSLNWPTPQHRPVGDIDTFNFGEHQRADDLMECRGIAINRDYFKHSVFIYNNFTVENHFEFLNTQSRKSSYEIERILETLVTCEDMIPYNGYYIPSANFNALYLLRHMAEHFSGVDITLKQLVDWGLFMKRFHKDIDYSWYLPTLEVVGMRKFFDLINAVCVEYLGFAADCFPSFSVDKNLVNRIINEILHPEFGDRNEPESKIARIIYKTKRWMANRWKMKLIYKENIYLMFIRQSWGHIIKPNMV